MAPQPGKVYTLQQLVVYFLKLGTKGFGGPVALVGYMHKDLVEKKQWVSEQEYKEGLALAQLAPGPLAAQLAIYLGFVHYRVLGATLAGIAFILPSFLMVVGLGMIYKLYGGTHWIQAVFYGVGASVTGIIAISSYKLTQKTIGQFTWTSFRSKSLLWIIFGSAVVVTLLTRQEHLLLFVGAGILYMLIKAPLRSGDSSSLNSFVLLQLGFWQYETSILGKLALFFFKAGAFVFGSGLAIVPFLHSGVVLEQHWLTEQQFLDAVAIAMITPGPVVITVGFIGYLVAGFPGACVAAIATFLPCYLFTILPAPYFSRIAKNGSVRAFVDGITAAVVGALVAAVIIISRQCIIDIPVLLIALLTAGLLLSGRRIPEPYIILAAAFSGILIKSFL